LHKTYTLLQKQSQVPQNQVTATDYFIYCLEAVDDVDAQHISETEKILTQLVNQYGVASIYKTCDTIEGLEDSLNTLTLDDHHFKDYEMIYLIMEGEVNSICLNNYYYSLQEIAELFEGRLSGKIVHFSNAKVLDLDLEEAQYFLDITSAKAISGYGNAAKGTTSANLDLAFFNLFAADDDLFAVVEELHKKHYAVCKLLDFRLYY